jgi:hypothetical protein
MAKGEKERLYTPEGVLKVLDKNKSKDFVDRILNSSKYPDMPTPGGKPGETSTHLMAYATNDVGAFAYPTIFYNKDTKKLFMPKDPAKYAQETGEFIRFNTEEDADFFTKNYKVGMGLSPEDMNSDEAMDYNAKILSIKK